MAAIIDGSTYPKFWKITPDDSAPNTFRLSEKSRGIELNSADATSGNIVFGNDTGSAITITYATTEDEFGNAINTAAKISTYLNANR